MTIQKEISSKEVKIGLNLISQTTVKKILTTNIQKKENISSNLTHALRSYTLKARQQYIIGHGNKLSAAPSGKDTL